MTWRIDSEGVIYDQDMKLFGFIDVNGDVYNADAIAPAGVFVSPPVGLPVGSVDSAGESYNAAQARLGAADTDGTLYNMGNLKAAFVDANDELRDLAGNLIATIDPSMHGASRQPNICPMPYRSAAGLFFILLNRQ